MWLFGTSTNTCGVVSVLCFKHTEALNLIFKALLTGLNVHILQNALALIENVK